jgi:hypothetical protein
VLGNHLAYLAITSELSVREINTLIEVFFCLLLKTLFFKRNSPVEVSQDQVEVKLPLVALVYLISSEVELVYLSY